MPNNEQYQSYLQLLSKVDAMFAMAVEVYPKQFACKVGCYGCCSRGLSVSNIEASFIREWIQAHSEALKQFRNDQEFLDEPNSCPLLDKMGGCVIYEARPLICRSHGMPITWSEINELSGFLEELKDVCPLNFTDMNIADINHANILGLDKVNTLLSLINRVFDEQKADQRIGLEELASEI